jgi:hypothetical protein
MLLKCEGCHVVAYQSCAQCYESPDQEDTYTPVLLQEHYPISIRMTFKTHAVVYMSPSASRMERN